MKQYNLVIILLIISFSAISQTNQVSESKIPSVEYIEGIYYLELDGKTSYERGVQHGTALKFVIKRSLRDFKTWIEESGNGKNAEEVISNFTDSNEYIQSVKEQLPELYREFEGIVDGAQVDRNELFAYQSFDEFYSYLEAREFFKNSDGHCTTISVFGREDLPNYLTHNNDLPTYHEGAITVLKIKYPNSDIVILQQTFAGQIGQNGVNNYGVAVGINNIADLPVSKKGIPVSFNVRKILETKNIEEALKYLISVDFGTPMNYSIADRQKAISVETWKNNIAVIDDKGQQYIAHTNHTLQENGPVTFQISKNGSTAKRLKIANKVLSENFKNIDFEGLRSLISNPPIDRPHGSDRTLMCTIISIPKTGNPILWTTPDSPKWFSHVKFTFEEK